LKIAKEIEANKQLRLSNPHFLKPKLTEPPKIIETEEMKVE